MHLTSMNMILDSYSQFYPLKDAIRLFYLGYTLKVAHILIHIFRRFQSHYYFPLSLFAITVKKQEKTIHN